MSNPCHETTRALGLAGVRGERRRQEPLTVRGLHVATMEPDRIDAWWERWSTAGVAIRTGPPGPVVLDVDGRDGLERLAKLEAQYRRWPRPDSPSAEAARGQHLCAPLNQLVVCSAGRVGSGLDVRGVGGYVVARPSRHPSGRFYTWIDRPGSVRLAPMPGSLLRLAEATPANWHRATDVERWRWMLRHGLHDSGGGPVRA
jgi:Bifunctional DNA primase/polymerase, N-terminal